MQPKIKVCGITDAAIAKKCTVLDIDAIGLVFYKKSPRFVDIKQANKIIFSLPPFINRVGLFVNAEHNFIDKVINAVAIDSLQFHGDETPKVCAQYELPFIKALRITSNTNLAKLAADYEKASALLLDAHHKEKYGGSGVTFDWSLVCTTRNEIKQAIILAGGLNENNVGNAIKIVKPYGIDVSSGVESTVGVKSFSKIKRFIKQVSYAK